MANASTIEAQAAEPTVNHTLYPPDIQQASVVPAATANPPGILRASVLPVVPVSNYQYHTAHGSTGACFTVLLFFLFFYSLFWCYW